MGTYDGGAGGTSTGTGGGAAGGVAGSAHRGLSGGSTAGGSAGGMPSAPYTKVVTTNDVSMLYPLQGTSADYLAPTTVGRFGPLLSRALVDSAKPNLRLERKTSEVSTYDTWRVVSIRLDPCSPRRGTSSCAPEVRLVLQTLVELGDAGIIATDGAIHLVYDVPAAELVTMMKQLLTLKKANGDVTPDVLQPHPILSQQGLSGAFAQGLAAIVLEHVGEDRLARLTFFDHNMDPDSDGWLFAIFDRTGSTLTAVKIPTTQVNNFLLAGTSAVDPLGSSGTFSIFTASTDDVGPLVDTARPDAGAPQVGPLLAPAYTAALRNQNPSVHNSESLDCNNCHLAEGARRLGEEVYGFIPQRSVHPQPQPRPRRPARQRDQPARLRLHSSSAKCRS
ncbi:MAG: hypothetical protein IPJ65_11570 [Archangiaceae bacterium]|nr:hypothetical protein [Archangiaceae bacterium]